MSYFIAAPKIPEELWDQLCKLVPEYGIGAVANAC